MMEIFDNPLTLKKLLAHIDREQVRDGTPALAADIRETAIYLGLRNCIWAGNTGCMQEILDKWPSYDLNRPHHRYGGLLHYAASVPLLMQGADKLKAFDMLIEHGADPNQPFYYYMELESYLRGSKNPPFRGSVADYLDRLEDMLKDPLGHAEITFAAPPKSVNNLMESLAYLKDRLKTGPSAPKPARAPFLKLVS